MFCWQTCFLPKSLQIVLFSVYFVLRRQLCLANSGYLTHLTVISRLVIMSSETATEKAYPGINIHWREIYTWSDMLNVAEYVFGSSFSFGLRRIRLKANKNARRRMALAKSLASPTGQTVHWWSFVLVQRGPCKGWAPRIFSALQIILIAGLHAADL